MSASDHTQTIQRGKERDETTDDLEVMVDILSSKRRERVDEDERQADDFALGILCFIFDPVKAGPYKQAMVAERRRYRGIASSPGLQQEFLDSLTDELLNAETWQDAVQLGIDALFARALVGTIS